MSSDSASLPTLPLEVKGHILRFCDVETLGRTSQASLAMLELSGPLLYRDITIRGKEQLEMMIRSETVLPSIAPFVSLAQTKTFTYVPRRFHGNSNQDVRGRLASSPVHIQELVIDARAGLAQGNKLAWIDVSILLSSYDPLHLRFVGTPALSRAVGCYIGFPVDLPWTRLTLFCLEHCLVSTDLVEIKALVDRTPLLDLIFDLSDSKRVRKDIISDLQYISDDLQGESTGGPRFGQVQVWVNNEEEVALAKSTLVGCSCTSLDIGVKQSTDA